MRLCRFDEGRLGLVDGDVVRDVTAALDVLPSCRYQLPRHDVLIAHLPDVQALFALVRTEGFAQLEGRYAPQGDCRDCTVHTITYYQPESEPKAVTVVEGASPTPDDLQAALEQFSEIAQDLGEKV